jgi:FxsC-like protein
VTSPRARYFFLSYAHSPPLAGVPAAPPDDWVRSFYRDLSKAVGRHASRDIGLAPGFVDMEIPVGANWKAEIVAALGAAEVFIPLLSPAYLTRSWPWREWTGFERRLEMAGVDRPERRFVPVLWVPLPSGERVDDVTAAMRVAPDDSVPYAQSGLLALRRLQPYRSAYRQVVERLARRIVDIAESEPMGPSQVPDIDQIGDPARPAADASVFTVVVAAPVYGSVPTGADSSAYGKSATDWRPFPGQEAVPLAEYARTVAEQLDFSVQVADVSAAGDILQRGPGIVLIDPWYAAREAERDVLTTFIQEAPSWILPVLGPATSAEGQRLAQDVTRILSTARPSATRQARGAMRGMRTLDEFGRGLPFLVTEAGHNYLRDGPLDVGERTVRGRPAPLYGEGHNRAKERPDA